MELARFIQTNMEQLLRDWEVAVLEIAPEMRGENSQELRDHARSMLEFICGDLATALTEDMSARKSPGKHEISAPNTGGKHGIQRLKHGLSMVQMVQELQALRARITRAWSVEQRGLTEKDMDYLVSFN